jgi:uncharacterized protein
VKDHLAVSDLAIAAYERAFEPKRLVLLPGGHFEAYVEVRFRPLLSFSAPLFLGHSRVA